VIPLAVDIEPELRVHGAILGFLALVLGPGFSALGFF
jgi:hypothetical protein